MSLRCIIGLHHWEGCKCSYCGMQQDKFHNWKGCKCTRCGKIKDEDHLWNGCKCDLCGKTRDEDHHWSDCKCNGCGKTRDEDHLWNGCKCDLCGKTRDEKHNWLKDRCKTCGTMRPKTALDVQLMEAVVKGRIDETSMLLRKGANPHVKEMVSLCTKEDWAVSPLHVAARMGQKEIVQLLIENGADVNERATTVGIPLHEAVAGGSVDCVSLLLSNGADPNWPEANRNDHCGRPLEIAVKTGLKQIAEILIAHGANINYDWGPGTVLDYAIEYWHAEPDMIKILLNHGAQGQRFKVTHQNPEAEFLVLCLCVRIPFSEDVFMVGDAKIPEVERLIELGDSAVDACKLGLGKTRVVYNVLARIGSRSSVDVLLSQVTLIKDMGGRPILPVPWPSTVLSCQALSRIENPYVLNAIPHLRKLEDNKIGEVVVASRQAVESIIKRFPGRKQF